MAELVLFGRGHHIQNYIRLLNFFQCKVDFIADNNMNKTGNEYHGIPVIDPSDLTAMDCRIIISCTYWKEITEQLFQMGIADRIVSLWEFLKESSAEILSDISKTLPLNQETKICLDLYSSAVWGGAENWNYDVAKELAKAGHDIRIFANQVIFIDEWNSEEKEHFSIQKFLKEDNFADMVNHMIGQLPIIFLNCFTEELFFAALAVKMIYPDKIKIIDELHLDVKQAYDLHVQFDIFFDSYICVSRKIKETLKTVYGIQEKRLFFREQPIETDVSYQRHYHMDSDRPLRIGYAARLVKEQKRADMLPILLGKLEKSGMDYILEIAGDGEEEANIKREIKHHRMEQKIRFSGRLNYSDMADFWKRQDIYINFSEYEGASLAMLEAMSFGCVPVVTEVSGVSDYIVNGSSGCICAIGDLETMAKRIIELYHHRSLIKKYGEAARREILLKCKKEDYAKALGKWIGETG